MVRTQIYLPKSLLELLKEKSKEQKTTISELIRTALEEEFRADKGKEYGESGPKTLLRVAELGVKYRVESKDNPKDLSLKVDEYLYGKE